MLIENTELEYNEEDEVCLDRYLGKHMENKDQWAQRVWNNCKAQSEGEEIARVYKTNPGQTWQQRAQELWENKKAMRKKRLCQEFNLKDAKKDTILSLKRSKKYKTADQLFDEEKERIRLLEKEVNKPV